MGALHRQFVLEELENRRLLSASGGAAGALMASAGNPVFLAAAHPSIRSSNPLSGATNVNRDAYIALAVNLVTQGAGVDERTLVENTDVNLYRTSDHQFVAHLDNTTGGGDGIVVKPSALLGANTNFTLDITTGVKDTTGNSFLAFTMNFTTGSNVANVDQSIRFDQVSLPNAQGGSFSALTMGPDGKLYAGTMAGKILRFAIQSDGQLGVPEIISTVKNKNTDNRFIIGLEFDPSSTASNLILWVSHAQGTFDSADDSTGKISRLTGPTLSKYTDFVVGLPRSVRDHLNNQIHFGPDGALYMGQGAMDAMGAADTAWIRPEHLLSAALLRMDVHHIQGTLDVRTPDAGGTYNPFAQGAPVTIYASGLRNCFDFVFDPNGHLYAGVNGSFAGGNTPAGPGNNPPPLMNVSQTESDWVFDVIPGKYYGHPDPLRNQFVLDGGNPTSGADYEEISAYPVGTQPDPNYQHAAITLGMDNAPTGMLVYQSNAFGGRLKGKILVARYSGPDDIFILTPSADGKTMTGINGVGMSGLADPLDIVENPSNGNLYVSQLATDGGLSIKLLKPEALPTIIGVKLVNADNSTAFSALKNKATIDLGTTPTKNLSVRVDTFGSVGSVIFGLDSNPSFQVENSKPFAIKGNNPDGSYVPWTPALGKHTLTFTAYSGANGTGSVLQKTSLSFTVVNSSGFRANINFQPGSDTVAFPGYRTDIGRLYGRRANGLTYGWSSSNEASMFNRDNPSSIDERFDTGAVMGTSSWSIKVPNGTYDVFLAAGDPSDFSGTYGITVEGTLAISGKPSASKPWLGKTVRVVVSDGNLTIARTSGSTGNKINFVVIAAVG